MALGVSAPTAAFVSLVFQCFRFTAHVPPTIGLVSEFTLGNFPSATSFPDDVGTYLLGARVVGVPLRGGVDGGQPAILIAHLAAYLTYVGVSLLLRARRGTPIAYGHLNHVYRRPVDRVSRSHRPAARLDRRICSDSFGWANGPTTPRMVVARINVAAHLNSASVSRVATTLACRRQPRLDEMSPSTSGTPKD